MTKRQRRFPLAIEQFDAKICPVGVPVVLTTMSLAFTPVTMAITNTVPITTNLSPAPTTNNWLPPLDTSPVPLVPGGPG